MTTAVITGASRGIGAALARRLANEGFGLVLAARNESELRAVADECLALGAATATPVRCDVGIPGHCARLVDYVAEGDRCVLVNNAGIGLLKLLHELSPDEVSRMMTVNLTGLIHCTQALLPRLRPGGHVVNILSISALRAIPTSVVYGATKAGALHFANCLREGYASEGLQVTNIHPGPVDTDIWDQIGFRPERMMSVEAVAETIARTIVAPAGTAAWELTLMPLGWGLAKE